MTLDFAMHCIGREVQFAGPDDCAEFESYLRKQGRVGEYGEDSSIGGMHQT